MSKNYKIGSKFRVTSNSTNGFNVGEIVNLVARRVDGLFEMDNWEFQQALYEDQFELVCEPLSQKLKPAKQALADAIHQNGGWGRVAAFASQDKDATICFFNCSTPIREGDKWVCSDGARYAGSIYPKVKSTSNWHQTILSRDEYFTAYPEQVMVENKNETEQKVEVEMKSESEATINASDWHKNGELPPVGEVCIFDPNGRTEFFDEKAIGAIGKEVSIISHVKFKGAVGSVAVFMCDSDGVAIVRTASETCFRPLRTERDKVIDEMKQVCPHHGSWDNVGRIYAEALYDAGYRKEAK